MVEQFHKIHAAIEQHYGKVHVSIASPLRINLIGEHTDFNDGFVFAAAINKFIFGAFAAIGPERLRLYALGFKEEFVFDVNALVKQETCSWKNNIP